jgi:hypothetical protein
MVGKTAKLIRSFDWPKINVTSRANSTSNAENLNF